MDNLTPKQHGIRALLFISGGVVLAIGPTIALYLNTDRRMVRVWLLLLLATMPAIGWGAAHLARARGYAGSAGCWLCVLGYLISGFVGTTSPHPLALGLGMLFIVLLPTVVLFAMPNKIKRSRRRRHRRPAQPTHQPPA